VNRDEIIDAVSRAGLELDDVIKFIVERQRELV
jgi:hypothetical protein